MEEKPNLEQTQKINGTNKAPALNLENMDINTKQGAMNTIASLMQEQEGVTVFKLQEIFAALDVGTYNGSCRQAAQEAENIVRSSASIDL